jgi:hypothetical protein
LCDLEECVEPPTPSGPCRSPPSWSAYSAPTWRPSGPGTAERCSATNAAASLWPNSGVPATEVARRLGHDVAVLLKIYVNCIDGQEGEINDRITAALTAHHDHETLPPAPAVDTAAQTKPADQSQDGRLWTPQDRRSALVAQGIEHRFPKALAVRCRRSSITPQQPAKTPVTQGRSLSRTRLASARTSVTICHCQAPSATVRGTDAA